MLQICLYSCQLSIIGYHETIFDNYWIITVSYHQSPSYRTLIGLQNKPNYKWKGGPVSYILIEWLGKQCFMWNPFVRMFECDVGGNGGTQYNWELTIDSTDEQTSNCFPCVCPPWKLAFCFIRATSFSYFHNLVFCLAGGQSRELNTKLHGTAAFLY